jgi:hypothetical protein
MKCVEIRRHSSRPNWVASHAHKMPRRCIRGTSRCASLPKMLTAFPSKWPGSGFREPDLLRYEFVSRGRSLENSSDERGHLPVFVLAHDVVIPPKRPNSRNMYPTFTQMELVL